MSASIVEALRQNHALEHATIALLAQRLGPATHLSGRSTPAGFYIYGDIPTPLVEEAAAEALARLQGGEKGLAISSLCGTNLAVSGLLAGLSSLAALGNKRRLERLPHVLLAALIATLVAPFIGRWVQRNLTTSTEMVEQLRIDRIVRRREGPWTVHKVETQSL